MKLYLTFTFSLLTGIVCHAQTHRIADQYIKEAELAAKEQDYQKAATLFEKSVMAEKACSYPRLKDLYISLENASYYFSLIGEREKAIVLQEEALENIEKSLGKQHKDYGTCLNNLAALYETIGKFDKALFMYLEALKNTKKALGKRHADYGIKLNNLAALYEKMGQYNKALPLYLEALENAEKALGKQHANYSTLSNNLAVLYMSMGLYDKALPLFLEALENTKKTQGKQHADYGLYSNNLALLFQNIGQYDKALPLYLEALENTEKALGKQHTKYGIYLNNLACLYERMEQYDMALPRYLGAVENAEKALGKQHPSYGSYLNNLAGLYRIMGWSKKALSLYIMALENTEKVLGKQHIDYGIRISNIAKVYENTGQYNEALPLYIEALENIEKNLGRQHSSYGISLNNLATIYYSMGQYNKALPFYVKGLENLKTSIGFTFNLLSEREKENYIKTVEYNFETYQSFSANYSTDNPDTAAPSYEVELLTKGMILSSSQQMRTAIEERGDTQALQLYEKWFAKKSGLARQYALPLLERIENLEKWEDEVEQLEKQLIQLSATFKENTKLGKTTWQDIRAALHENEVAIELASFQNYYRNWTDSTLYTALILKKGFDGPILVPLFEQKQLDSLLVAGGSDATRVAGLYRGSEAKSTVKNHKKLYDLIWKPLEGYLNEKETIYFAPSGSLHQIAFSAIVTPDGKYLSDKYTLHQVSTTAKLLHTPKAGDFSNISLFGGIDYTTPQEDLLLQAEQLKNDAYVSRSLTSDLERGTESWNYLPGTLIEVNAIKETARKAGVSVKYFTGKTALEEHFKQQRGKASPTILHVATHGFFLPDPKKQYKDHQLMMESEKNVYRLSDNPLNRSGLLFSGANTAWKGEPVAEGLEDGILTAYEASNVSLTNTRLVVLSACETGLGDIKGSEGVFGLQRAFKLAGAEYLLMSLWKVPDTETAEFMEKFYQLLFASKDIERSYGETQQFMKEKYPKEPYKWAAFVLMR